MTRQAAGWAGMMVIGVILIITGLSGRFGILFAAIFAPGEIQKGQLIAPDVTSSPGNETNK